MTRAKAIRCAVAALLLAAALASPVSAAGLNWLDLPHVLIALTVLLAITAISAWRGTAWSGAGWVLALVALAAAAGLLQTVHHADLAGQLRFGYWLAIFGTWLVLWQGTDIIADLESRDRWGRRLINLVVPALFGIWILVIWEAVTVGFAVPQVLLPAPSLIAARFAGSIDILWADFVQTFVKAVLSGYAMGCGAGLIAAVLVDRSPFLQRGLLPLGNLVSALPIVGVAPIMVMWFGFDWPSKAAVVIVMTFFPMLVNTVAGLGSAGALERDLMHSYGANYWATLFKLRLPNALPFIFNALKINSTLALIGAIVAEFFGTPIVGMGFRISTEVGRMNVDMVWAEIVVAALAGSLFFGLVALIERILTFWHPSYRATA